MGRRKTSTEIVLEVLRLQYDMDGTIAMSADQIRDIVNAKLSAQQQWDKSKTQNAIQTGKYNGLIIKHGELKANGFPSRTAYLWASQEVLNITAVSRAEQKATEKDTTRVYLVETGNATSVVVAINSSQAVVKFLTKRSEIVDFDTIYVHAIQDGILGD